MCQFGTEFTSNIQDSSSTPGMMRRPTPHRCRAGSAGYGIRFLRSGPKWSGRGGVGPVRDGRGVSSAGVGDSIPVAGSPLEAMEGDPFCSGVPVAGTEAATAGNGAVGCPAPWSLVPVGPVGVLPEVCSSDWSVCTDGSNRSGQVLVASGAGWSGSGAVGPVGEDGVAL